MNRGGSTALSHQVAQQAGALLHQKSRTCIWCVILQDEGPRGRKHRHDDTEEEDDEDMPEDSTGPDEGPEAVPSHPVFNPNLMSAAGASVDVLSGILLHNARVQQVALEQQGCGPLAGYSHAGQMGLYGTAGMHPAPMIDPFRQTASPTHTASEQSHGLVEAGTPRKSPFANIPPMSLGMPQMPANGLFFGAGNPPGGKFVPGCSQFVAGPPTAKLSLLGFMQLRPLHRIMQSMVH